MAMFDDVFALFIVALTLTLTLYDKSRTDEYLARSRAELENCLQQQAALCYVDNWRWMKLLLIVLWTVLATLSTPRFLLACLHALGYPRAGGLSRVAHYLRNWSSRRRYVRFQAFLTQLERYARLGWTIRVGVLLMAGGGVYGLCFGVWMTGIV